MNFSERQFQIVFFSTTRLWSADCLRTFKKVTSVNSIITLQYELVSLPFVGIVVIIHPVSKQRTKDDRPSLVHCEFIDRTYFGLEYLERLAGLDAGCASKAARGIVPKANDIPWQVAD